MAVYEGKELEIVVNGKVHKVLLADPADVEEVKKVLESLGENAYQWKGMTTSKDQNLNDFYGKDYIGYWSDSFGIQNLPVDRTANEWVLIRVWGTITTATNVCFEQEVIYPIQQLHFIRSISNGVWTNWKKYSLLDPSYEGIYKSPGTDYSSVITKVNGNGSVSSSGILLKDVVEQNNPNTLYPATLNYSQNTGWNTKDTFTSVVALANGYSPGVVGQGKVDSNQMKADNTIVLPILNPISDISYRHLYTNTNKSPLNFSDIQFKEHGGYLYSNKNIEIEIFDPYIINNSTRTNVNIIFAISIDSFATVDTTTILSFGGKCDNGWDRFAIRYVPHQQAISLLVMNKSGTSQIYNDNICEIKREESNKPIIVGLTFNNGDKTFSVKSYMNNSPSVIASYSTENFSYEMDNLFELDEQKYFHLCPGLAFWGISEQYGVVINPFYFSENYENKMRTQYIPNSMVLSQITGDRIKSWDNGAGSLNLKPLTLTLNGSSTDASYDGSKPISKSWYAPTAGGTSAQILRGNGSSSTPVWVTPGYLRLTLNGTALDYYPYNTSNNTKSWYAPTSPGTTGNYLVSNGGGEPSWEGNPYYECNTDAIAALKEINITNFKLVAGKHLYVKFNNDSYTDNNNQIQLTINGTSKSVYWNGEPIKINTKTGDGLIPWQAGDIVEFMYDGTYWHKLRIVNRKEDLIVNNTVAYTSNLNSAGVEVDTAHYKDNEAWTKVLSIPGASSLNVTVTYQSESDQYDWGCIWSGNHPEYTANNNHSSSASGKLAGQTKTTKTFNVVGDTITVAWKSDGSQHDYYGLYVKIEDASKVTTAASYIVSTQAELDALKPLLITNTNMGKIILKAGSFSISYNGLMAQVVIEGMGIGITNLSISTYGADSSFNATIKNLSLKAGMKLFAGTVQLIDCETIPYSSTTDYMFYCINLYVRGGYFTQNGVKTEPPCNNGVYCNGSVKFIDCNIIVDSGSTSYYSGYDLNLIYQATDVLISNCNITCKGNNRTNIVYNGKNVITGCNIYLENQYASICHDTTSTTTDGAFTGNYVAYYATRMKFGTITGNQFYHSATGTSSSNKIILHCPTAITGNNFSGYLTYIDGQSKVHVVTNNLHDNGLSFTSMGSNSLYGSGNIQY